MKPTELSQALVLDVRLEDDFEAEHLAGARNNCVFEVAFNERMAELAPDRDEALLVYGWNAATKEAEMAVEKLKRMGYSSVALLEGGLEAAREAGMETVTGKPLPPTPEVPTGTVAIDTAESRVGWTGRNLLNRHWGEVAITRGNLTFTGGLLTGGEVVLDLRQLTCTDLADSEHHDVLIAHLHNDDFFDAENHPHATVAITQALEIPNAPAGAPNLEVTADLTLRGVTHPISFAAATGLTPEGKAAAQATFSIDRTRWGVLYGSGKFFHRLAGHLVNDLIDFEVKIITK